MTRTISTYSVLIFVCIILFGCSSNDVKDQYRVNKKYWNVNDYKNAIGKITYSNKKEKKPCYSVPETAPIFKKLVDQKNVSIVLEDHDLGIHHKSDFATAMFDIYKDMANQYDGKDREDKFIYPMELTDILKFGLYIQLYYFQLGNEVIIQQSDNPDAGRVKGVLRQNEQTLIGNYCVYLDFVKQEKAFTSDALNSYIEGIDYYFPLVLKKFPNADYSVMIKKTKDMINKSESTIVKVSLETLLKEIDSNRATT